MWKLVIEDDEGKRTDVVLSRGNYTIGRREGSNIRLTERNISRDHARLYEKKAAANGVGPFVLEDLTSYNGVFVNGLRISHAQDLENGDLIQIGDYRIVFQDESATDAPVLPLTVADDKATVPAVPPPTRGSALLDRPDRLVMLVGPTPGSEFPLDRERLTIGRAEDANISINHGSVSRLHGEIHAFGEGRFEIVDKGSSNGVRVNGAELRRGIIEPGDVIELGDVEFKFVGAGQIFRPDKQTLRKLGERAPSTMPPATRKFRGSNTLPFAVFLAVAFAGTLGAWTFTRAHSTAHPKVAPLSVEDFALQEALKLCANSECEAAHERLQSDIRDSSPLRDTPEFKGIESRWAEGLLARAETSPDVPAKRALYQRVSQALTVDPEHRRIAADRLQQLDSTGAAGAANPLDLPPAAGKAHAEENPMARTEGNRRTLPANEAPPGPGAGAGLSPSGGAGGSRGSAGGIEERERQLALTGTPDSKMQLKQQLEPRVYSGRASEAEIRLLISTCKDLADRPCVQQARAALKGAP